MTGYVLFNKVMIKTEIPKASVNGRTYCIKEDEMSKTQNYFDRQKVL